jgi:TRAP-type C4-dicarboxylate transport system permease small subunit
MKLKASNLAIILIVFVCLFIDFDLKNWEKRDRVIEHDIHWYYSYLPATFIYDDIELQKSNYLFDGDYYLFWPIKTPEGKNLIKTTMGASILYAPFFFVAHAYVLHSDYPANGFSEPYKLFLLLSALFYLFVGLDFVKKTLQHLFFSDTQIAITLLIVGLGTNLLCYSSQSAPMTHVYNFFLFAIFTYYTIKWYEKQSIKHTLILGMTIGLISLIRPSNAVIILFFILYNISNRQELKQRIRLFTTKFYFILLIAFVSFLVWVPQFMYWKTVTGNFLFYSYTDEGFYFSEPKILLGLFSFRKGWLIYTPIMAFALIGLFYLKDSLKKQFYIPILFFFLFNIYIVFSWWCWWYGGTFGQRSLIESYAILAIPLASFVQQVLEKKKFVIYLFFALCLFFIWLNIFQTYQFENMSLHYDGMTKELYFKQFGKMKKIKDFHLYVNSPNYDEAKGLIKEQKKVSLPETESLKIYLKASNGKYVCADNTKNDLLIADRAVADLWELFTLTMYKNGNSVLQSHEHLYVSANLSNENKIDATRAQAADWEFFKIKKMHDNFISIQATNNKYISVDEITGQLYGRSDSVGKNETFELIIVK